VGWKVRLGHVDAGELLYYLKAVPWIVPDFAVETYLPELEKLQRRLDLDGTLTFHQTLMLIRASKLCQSLAGNAARPDRTYRSAVPEWYYQGAASLRREPPLTAPRRVWYW
jgi:hypothetical protein